MAVNAYLHSFLSFPSFLPFYPRQWRAKQQEEIRKRDEDSDKRREETIAKAERAIDKFYEDYNVTKEKNIKANKRVLSYRFDILLTFLM